MEKIVFFIVLCLFVGRHAIGYNGLRLKEVRCLEISVSIPSNVYTKIQMLFSGGKLKFPKGQNFRRHDLHFLAFILGAVSTSCLLQYINKTGFWKASRVLFIINVTHHV